MKIQELRNLLKSVDRDKLEKAFAESYKQFTKRQKEEVDLLICDIFEGKETPKVAYSYRRGKETDGRKKAAIKNTEKI